MAKYRISYIDKKKYLQTLYVNANTWLEIQTQISQQVNKDDIDYIVSITREA